MNLPKMIQQFMLHNVTQTCHYKGKPLFTAHYMKIGSYVNLYIRSKADMNGALTYLVEIKGTIIDHIPSIDDAIRVAEELLVENNMFTS
ncbi:MAG: hypothetical protein OMM_06401 [Candidatus Magnetoglobus multicellularis str. Araruama]|uniref:Uncharacterized protein n=1 Tax=Candidatus Magnetoglobus multicellularis str. Araruama TaxID=890399 RepID=A0A1V1PHY3_9BACT|nr:MAG: hypothetical protein OMM_06401 [Candidatus Magnetoglobus multicellularis str. Araruama]